MELTVGDSTIIEQAVNGMSDVCSRIYVVTGHLRERIDARLEKYGNVITVFNKNYRQGMFSSVQEGVKHLTGKPFFILPGDTPWFRGTFITFC